MKIENLYVYLNHFFVAWLMTWLITPPKFSR